MASSKGSRRNVVLKAALRLGGYDLTLALPVAVIWHFVGVMHFGVVMAMVAVRALGWGWLLQRRLAPVRRFELAGEACTDEELLAADDAIQHLHRRFGVPYCLSWALVFALSLWLSYELESAGSGMPRAELLASGLLLAALIIAALDSLTTLFAGTLLEVRTRISAALIERELPSRRPRRSLRDSASRKKLSAITSMILGLGAIAGMLHVRGIREAALVEQRRQAELSALRVDAERGAPLEGVVLVTRPELPPPLGPELEARSEGEAASVFDPRHGRALAAAPLGDGRWALAQTEPDQQLGWVALGIFALVFAAGVPGSMSGRAYGSSVADPILQLDEATRNFLERGEIRALARIVPLQDDEVGRLAANFNTMLDLLEELARAAETVAAGDLTVELPREGELHDAFRAMVRRLAETVARLRQTSLELGSTAAELHALSLQQDEAEQEQSATVQQVSGTVTSLADSAKDIASTAKIALADAEQAVATTDRMAERITELRSQTASITELLDAIREIADRSDLLALNGSLEATRAGDAGRGFALVAAEMRRLAERVTGTVSDVRERVSGIETSGHATVLATEESRKLAQRAAEAARTISGVTARQSADTEQAADGVQSVASMVAASPRAARRDAGSLRILDSGGVKEAGHGLDAACGVGAGNTSIVGSAKAIAHRPR